MINELSKQIHANAKSKGFHEGETNIGQQLMLIVTEVAEACEADRVDHHPHPSEIIRATTAKDDKVFKSLFEKNIKNTFPDELTDIVIRVLDLAGLLNIDLETHIQAKMRYNATREYKHGKKY